MVVMMRQILNDEKTWKPDYQPPKARLCYCLSGPGSVLFSPLLIPHFEKNPMLR